MTHEAVETLFFVALVNFADFRARIKANASV